MEGIERPISTAEPDPLPIAIDEFSPLIDEYGTQAADLMEARYIENARHSIFSAEGLRELESVAGKSFVEGLTNTKTGIGIQAVSFVLLAMFIGLTPFFTEVVLWDPTTQTKSMNFLPQTPYIVEFTCTVIFFNIIVAAWWGFAEWRKIWNLRSIIYFSPISIFHGTSDAIEVMTMTYIDAALRAVLQQLKLPSVSLFRWLFYGHRQTAIQTVLVMTIPLSVVAYITAGGSVAVASAGALSLGITNTYCGVFSGLFADRKLKKSKDRYLVQAAQLRFTTSLTLVVALIIYCWYFEKWGQRFFEGWNWGVVGLTIWILGKDWNVLYVMKHLNAVWAALAGSIGLCIAYCADSFYFQRPFVVNRFCLVLVLACLVCCYALTRREQHNAREVKA